MSVSLNANEPPFTVLSGKCFSALPRPSPDRDRLFRQLKIYVASNWNSCKMERRTLFDEVLPRLQCYALQFGLDVALVDVQSGAPFDHALDATSLSTHLAELDECSQTSSGPSFICMLNERVDGDDVLTPVLPVTISPELMSKLRAAAASDLPDRWYAKERCNGNGNGIGNGNGNGNGDSDGAFVLSSVSDRFPQLLNQDADKHAETLATVRQEHNTLVQLLAQHMTLKSAIETEVERALQTCASKSVFVFHAPITSKCTQAAQNATSSVVQSIKQRVTANAVLAESVITLRSNIDCNTLANSDTANSEPSDDDADEVATFQRSFSDQLFSRLLRIIDASWSKASPQNDTFCRLIKRYEARNFSTHLGYKLLNDVINCAFHDDVLPRRVAMVSDAKWTRARLDARRVIESAFQEHLSTLAKPHSPLTFTLFRGALRAADERAVAYCDFLSDFEVAQQFNAVVKQHFASTGSNQPLLYLVVDAETCHSLLEVCATVLSHLETLLTQPASQDGHNQTSVEGDAVLHADSGCSARLVKRVADVSKALMPSKAVLVLTVLNLTPSLCDAFASLFTSTVPANVIAMATARATGAADRNKQSVTSAPSSNEEETKTLEAWKQEVQATMLKIESKFASVHESSRHALRLVMQLLAMNLDGVDESHALDFLRQSACTSNESPEQHAVWMWHALKHELLSAGFLQPRCRHYRVQWRLASAAVRECVQRAYFHMRHALDAPDTFRWLHRTMLQHLYQVDEPTAGTPKRDSCASTKANHTVHGSHRASHLSVLKALPKISSFDADEIFEARSKKRRTVPVPLQYADGEFNVSRLHFEWFHFVHAKSFEDVSVWFPNVFNIERQLAVARSMGVDALIAMLHLVLKHFFVSDVHVLRLVLQAARRVLLQNPNQLAAEMFLHAGQFMSLLQTQNGTTHRNALLNALLQQCVQFYEKCDDQIALIPLCSWIKPIVPQFDILVESLNGTGAAALLQDNQHLFWITDAHRCITKFSLASGAVVKCLERLTDKQFTCLIVSNDDSKLYVGATDCTVRQYSTKNEELQHIFTGHRDAVTCVAVTLDGKLVCSGSKDKTIRIYNANSKQLVSSTPVHDGSVRCVLFSKSAQLAITGGADFKVKVWFVEDMTLMHVFEEYVTPITAIALTPDTSFLLVACEDRRLSVKSLISGKDVHELETIQEYATTLSVSSDCHHVAVGCADGVTYIYNLRTMDLIQRIAPPLVSVLPAAIGVAPSTHRASVSGSPFPFHESPVLPHSSQPAAVRGLARAMSIASPMGHSMGRRGAAEGPPASCMETAESAAASDEDTASRSGNFPCASCDEYVRSKAQMDADGAAPVANSDAVKSVQFTRCGQHVLVTQRGCARLVRVQLPSFMQQFVDSFQHSRKVTCICLSRDGRIAATGSDDNMIKIWNLLLCDFSLNLVGHDGRIETMHISNDEQFLVSAGRDRRCIVWHTQTGRMFLKYAEHEADVMQLALFGEDDEYGIRCVSMDAAGVSKLWRIDTGETFVTLKSLQFNGLPIAITSNFQLALSSASPNSIAVCMLSDGRVMQQISHKEKITCFTLSKDSQYVITGSVDTSLKVWQTRTARLTQVLAEHEDAIACVAMTDNNQRVVSGSKDCTAIIWDLSTGAVCTKLTAHCGPVTQVRIAQDTNIVLTASLDKTLRAWSLQSGSQLTWFYVHYPVVDMQMTFDASRILLRLQRSCNLVILSLRVTEKFLERMQQEAPKPSETQAVGQLHGLGGPGGGAPHPNPRVKLQRSMTMPANVIQQDPTATGSACISYRHRQSPFKQTTLIGMFKEQEKNRQQRLQSLLRRPDAWLLGSRVSISSNRSTKVTTACTLL